MIMLQSKSYSLDKKIQTDGHTDTDTDIVATILKHALRYFTNINTEQKTTFEYQRNNY